MRSKTGQMRRIGVHASIAGGLYMGISRAHRLGCTTVQLFSHNPRSWSTREITDEEDADFRRLREEFDVSPVYVHASYLINIASPSEELRAKSVSLLEEEMLRAGTIGADFVVLHTGSAHDGHGLERAVSSLREALGKRDYGCGLLIENTSGKKGDIAAAIPEMARIIEGAGGLVEGVCLDTCHAFAAGYDLREKAGAMRLLLETEELIGLDRLKLLHLNDSKGGPATGLDRHEQIGRGKIGAEALGRFITLEALREVPLILETPRESDKDDLANLRKVREMLGSCGAPNRTRAG